MELWKWWIPAEHRPGKLRQSHRMTEEEAQRLCPGCRRVEGSRLEPPPVSEPSQAMRADLPSDPTKRG